MVKVIINVHDCVPGMKVAETVFNEYGATIIGENTILDDHLINKLRNLDIKKVKIYRDKSSSFVYDDTELFKAQYTENVEIIKDLLHDISVGKKLDLKKVDKISDSVTVRINERRDIVRCISQIRSVDEYTYTHSVNTSMISMLIGKWMKFEPKRIKLLVQAGLLHDIGKMNVPQEIINKPSSLSEEEFEEIKKHPIYGYEILAYTTQINKEVCSGVLLHHERDDGSGYPAGVKGNQISDLAKIVAIADIYDAMTSNRVYKEKDSPFEVFKLMEEKTFGLLDTRAVFAFLSNIASYYIGDHVKLNTGEIGEIIYINPRHISKPLVKVGKNYLDLTVENNIRIIELL